jgi:hypothetical protein
MSTSPPSQRWSRGSSVALLVVLCAVVLWLNHVSLERAPAARWTNHNTALILPNAMRLLSGYPLECVDRQDGDNVAAVATCSHALQKPEGSDPGLLAALAPGGRLSGFAGRCSHSFMVCLPHSIGVPALVALAAPGSPVWPAMVPGVWLVVLLLAMYGIVREYAGPWAGLAAAAMAAGYPGLFGYSRFLEGYVEAAAVATAMVWCLVRSRGFSRPLPVLGLGLLAWTGLRTGEGFSEGLGAGLAVVGPFLLVLAGVIRRALRERAWPWRSLAGLGGLGLFLVISTDIPWVIASFQHVFTGFSDADMAARVVGAGAESAPAAVAGPLAYLLLLWSDYLLPVPSIALLVGLILLLVPGGGERRGRALVLLWLIIPVFAYSLMLRKAMWYFVPALPPMAAVTALGLASLRWRWPRTVALGLAGSLALAQNLLITGPIGLATPLPLRPLIDPPELMPLELRRHDFEVEERTPGDAELTRFAQHIGDALDRDFPPSGRLRYLGVIEPERDGGMGGRRLGFLLAVRRPDVVVVSLTVPVSRPGVSLAGLDPDDFVMLVQTAEARPARCCDLSSLGLDAARLESTANGAFVTSLLARSGGPMRSLPMVRGVRAGGEAVAPSPEATGP